MSVRKIKSSCIYCNCYNAELNECLISVSDRDNVCFTPKELDDIYSSLTDIQHNLPFSGIGCDMEDIEPACVNCAKYYDCLVGGEKDVRYFFCNEYEGKG